MKLSELSFHISKEPEIYASFFYKNLRDFRKQYERIISNMTEQMNMQDLLYSECIGAIAFIASNSELNRDEVDKLCCLAETAYNQYGESNSLNDLCKILMLITEPLTLINSEPETEARAMDTCKNLIESNLDKISPRNTEEPASFIKAMNFFNDEYIAGKVMCVNDTPDITKTYYKHLYQSCKSRLGKKPEDIPSMFAYVITAKKSREALLYYKLSEHILNAKEVEEWYPLIDFYYTLEAEATNGFLKERKYNDTDVSNYVRCL